MAPTNPASDGKLLNVLIRLMTPFLREFHQPLDVNRFLAEAEYAWEIVDRTLRSDNPRILGAGQFLRDWLEVKAQENPLADAGAGSQIGSGMQQSAGSNGAALSKERLVSPPVQDALPAKYVKRLR